MHDASSPQKLLASLPMHDATQTIVRHLIYGWQGFVGIIGIATKKGLKLDADCITRLTTTNKTLQDILEQQKCVTEPKADRSTANSLPPTPAP